MEGSSSQRFHFSHSAALKRPQLPVVTNALKLSVSTHAHAPTGAGNFSGLGRQLRENMFIIPEPRATTRPRLHNVIGYEALNFFVIVNFRVGVEIVLRPRTTISHKKGWCISHAAPSNELNHILVEWHNRKRMFVSVEAIDSMCEI